jgi:hypothetical protein
MSPESCQRNCKDHTISQPAGTRLSYLGYDFEAPWNDLDQSKTELYPKEKSEKRSVICVFNSGLRLVAQGYSTTRIRRFVGHGFQDSAADF